MLGHNVTSPLLFGVASTNGFSSNADELRNSTILYENMVIRPLQDEIIAAIDKIINFNGISLKLQFVKLNPLDSAGDLTLQGVNKGLIDAITNLSPLVANKVIETLTPNEIRSIVGLAPESGGSDLNPELLSSHDDKIAQALIDLGEEPSEEWLLIDEFEVDYDNDDAENELLSKEPKQSLLSKVYNFVSTGTANPNAKSEQDENIDGVRFITRYVYTGLTSADSRQFCQRMMAANKVYRKEDIIRMGTQVVNEGWGPKGANTYDIWKYKGGGNCHHRWNKQVYANFEGRGIDVKSPKAKQIAQAKAEKYGYVIKNNELVSKRPVDMPNYGFLPSNPQPKREITK